MSVKRNGPFTDFARNEIYAFHRMTIILSTFIITASFAILSFGDNSSNSFMQSINMWFFLGVVSVGLLNIIVTWRWLYRSVIYYYNKLDKKNQLSVEELDTFNNIENTAEKKDNTRRWTFYICFVLFILFLGTSDVFQPILDMILKIFNSN